MCVECVALDGACPGLNCHIPLYRHGPELVRADGHNIPPLLKAVTKLLPLDSYVKCPVMLMDLVPDDKAKGLKTPVWDEYKKIVNEVVRPQVMHLLLVCILQLHEY